MQNRDRKSIFVTYFKDSQIPPYPRELDEYAWRSTDSAKHDLKGIFDKEKKKK
jgi:hypothetical protein